MTEQEIFLLKSAPKRGGQQFPGRVILQCFLFGTIIFVAASCGAKPHPEYANKSVDELIELLKSKDSIERAHVVIALGYKKEAAKEAIPYLIKLLNDRKAHVRNRAMNALSSIGPAALPALLEALESRDRVKRFYAAHTLKKINDPRAKEAYERWLEKEGKELAMGLDKNFRT